MKILRILPLIFILLVITALGWKLVSGQAPAMVGRASPAVSLPSVMHPPDTMRNASFNADVSVVNIFASWCAPCTAELPMLKKLSQVKGVKVYGIAWHDQDEALKTWIKKYSPPFADIGNDSDGRTAIAFGIRGVPESFFIDRNGSILYHQAGIITEEDLQRTILPLIKRNVP
jgi:cytochrome c biogenesis protein CcmG/thiol:disulfide interchange protein DsbE